MYFRIFLLFVVLGSPYIVHSQNWEQVGLGGHEVNDLFVDTSQNILYGSGSFVFGMNDTTQGIASFDGIQWVPVGNKIQDPGKIILFNDHITTSTRSGAESYVVSFNGTDWDTLGGTFDNIIHDFAVYNNQLVAVGFFTEIDSVHSRNIAILIDSNWVSFDTTIWFLSEIHAIIGYKNNLYIGGIWISSLESECLLSWNGNEWDVPTLGINTDFSDDGVFSFCPYNDKLFVAGEYVKSGSNPNPGNCIASWDGTSWSDIGGGVDNRVKDLTVHNNELYAVGDFWNAGGVPASKIAKWDENQWCGLGTMFSGSVNTAISYKNELYVGGNFTSINGFSILGVAKWTGGDYVDTCGAIQSAEHVNGSNYNFTLYPNPSNGTIFLQLPAQHSGPATITIHDITGKAVLTKETNQKSGTILLDSGILPNGLYIVRVERNSGSWSKKIVIEK